MAILLLPLSREVPQTSTARSAHPYNLPFALPLHLQFRFTVTVPFSSAWEVPDLGGLAVRIFGLEGLSWSYKPHLA